MNNKTFITLVVLLVALFVAVIAMIASSNKPTQATDSEFEKVVVVDELGNGEILDETNPIVTMEIEEYGTMKFELYPKTAPESVNNFISLINSGFYDNLTMHRLVAGFMIQGGDPDGTGTGGPGYGIKGEFTTNNVQNTVSHQRGSLAMARSGEPDSAGSQFYVCFDGCETLNGSYAVFGQLIEGGDVLQKLEPLEVEGETPKDTITIKSVKVDTKGVEYKEPNKL